MQTQRQTCFISQLVESFCFEDAKLPSLPGAVIYLDRAIRDDSVSLLELSRLVEKDPVLAARLIRVANSAFYRGISAIESVPDAVTRIGFSATRNIALVLLDNSFQARHKAVEKKIAELWKDSLSTAAMAAALTRYYSLVDANRAMLGGLMYNVGAMLLLTIIDEKVESTPNAFILDHMITNHAPEFGRKLLQHWEMDPDLLAVVENRDHWQRAHSGSPDLTDLVLVASCCVRNSVKGELNLEASENLPSYLHMSQFLQLSRPLEQVVFDVRESIDEMLEMLSG